MAHEKVYGICEDKCRVEVYPKTQTYSKTETDTKIATTNNAVNATQTTANGAVTRLDNNLAKFKANSTDLATIKAQITQDASVNQIGGLLADTLTVIGKLFGEDLS